MKERKYVTPDQIHAVVCDVEEAETVIQIDRTGNVASVWSSDNTMITKIKSAFAKGQDSWTCWEGSRNGSGELTGYFFECPKSLISFRSVMKARKVTDEQRAAARERLKKFRRTKKAQKADN